MHFKLDENIPIPLTRLIKRKDHTVSSVFSENISGINDKELLKICKKSNFILITLDKDFVNVQAYPPSNYPGIIVLKLKSQGTLSVIDAFENFMNEVPLERAKNSLIIIEEKNIRIRT
ncbi:MAG: hypothetical protein CMH61_01235 [Nanoarchaeota archaeon]|nr:hypothetical protein [Nanoarchaeota archaeon]|tara:strand:- start:4506 stop:4859 length:354 start_codon:yes stop_codon:yes gene_type:complete